MNFKKIAAGVLSLGLVAGTLTGCYTKVKSEDYATTKIASFGDKNIMMDEFNYYVRLYQSSNDNYQQIYAYYYGLSSYKEMYEYVVDKDKEKTLWDSVKEDAMRAINQTYVLCSHADEYGVSLTDEDKEKVDDAVKEFFEGDSGLVAAVNISEEHLKEILTRNAIAYKVYDYLVKDIDTTVDEAEFRHTVVSYIKVTQAEKEETTTASASETTAETTEAETTEATEEKKVDLKAAAEKIKAEWKDALDKDEKKDSKSAANTVVESYEDSKEIAAAYTDSTNYAKPTESTDSSSSTSSSELQKYCWNELKTGDFGIYEDTANSCVYVIYCKDDDDADTKASSIESELETRRSTMFKEKYPDIVKASASFDVNTKIYSQVKWNEIEYDVETTAETTTAATTTASETTGDSSETTAAETTAASETTVTDTTATETTESVETTVAETTEQ